MYGAVKVYHFSDLTYASELITQCHNGGDLGDIVGESHQTQTRSSIVILRDLMFTECAIVKAEHNPAEPSP